MATADLGFVNQMSWSKKTHNEKQKNNCAQQVTLPEISKEMSKTEKLNMGREERQSLWNVDHMTINRCGTMVLGSTTNLGKVNIAFLRG